MPQRAQASASIAAMAAIAVLIAACSGSGTSSTAALATQTSPTGQSSAAAVPSDSLAKTTAEPTLSSTPPPASAHPKKPLPSLDPKALAAYLTSSITVYDLADTDLAASVTYLDPSGGQPGPLGTHLVDASGQLAESVPPGTYRIDFRLPSSASSGSRCTIVVKDGAAVTFVAVPGAIAVSRAGFTPKNIGDLFVATSSLCKA